jgi:hypothetical protein
MRRFPLHTASAIVLLSSAGLAFQNLPYVAVHDPQFIPAAEATFLQPGDRLIGVTIGNVAKAYPAGILSQHGLVEDRLPSGMIAATW